MDCRERGVLPGQPRAARLLGALLVAANRVFKSTDHGDSWTVISPDLTTNTNRDTVVTMGVKGSDITIGKNDGIVSYSTIVALAESPKQAGVYYTGSDDGVVSMTRDGGKSWQPTQLGNDEGKYGFRQWQPQFTPPSPRKYAVMVRCTNSNGENQPDTANWNPAGFMRNVIETTDLVAA